MSASCWLLTIQSHWRQPLTVAHLSCRRRSIGVRLVQMVGKLGRDIVEKGRCDDGSLSIPVPQSDKRINVVDRYRYLGTIVMASGNDVTKARLRAKSTKEAYGPLKLRIFGSEYIPAPMKLSLYMIWLSLATPFRCTLHHSRSTPFGLLLLCTTRALRRIVGAPRFQRDEHALRDLDFRRTLIVPSYDCIMMRGRSRYIGRIIRTQPTTLLAMSTPLECFLRVQEDLRCAWNNRGIVRERTTPP